MASVRSLLRRFAPCRTALICIGAASVAGCSGDREAEAETPVAEAQVSTELPESVVSDNRLEATANAAAQVASTPPSQVVVVPVPVGGNGQASAGAAPPAEAQQNAQR